MGELRRVAGRLVQNLKLVEFGNVGEIFWSRRRIVRKKLLINVKGLKWGSKLAEDKSEDWYFFREGKSKEIVTF